MTTPAQLAQRISAATGVPLPTVIDTDRKLVAAGLRTKAGRGRGSARMTAMDAARILTALLASPQANTSAEALERYRQTQPDKSRSCEGLFRTLDLADLAGLSMRHSFVDGIASLISSAATGSLAKLIASAEQGWTPKIEVFAFTRATYGRIRISGMPDGPTANVEYLPPATKARRAKTVMSGPENSTGDLEQSRRITERTILQVAQLLAEEESSHDRIRI